MRADAGAASPAPAAPLTALGRVVADAMDQLAAADAALAAQAVAVVDHVAEVVDFASQCATAVAADRDVAAIVPPARLAAPDVAQAKHFAATVGRFVPHAKGEVVELAREARQADAGDEVAAIRRTVHTLRAEFGVLAMAAPQALCQEIESALDACAGRGQPLPMAVLLPCLDALQQFLERLAIDVHAPFGDAESLAGQLRAIASGSAAADAATVRLRVGGEFAGKLDEFVTQVRASLDDIERAMGALSRQPQDAASLALARRAFHTIGGIGGFLDLAPLAELAHAATAVLDGLPGPRRSLSSSAGDLLLAAGGMIRRLVDSLSGLPAPRRSDWRQLLGNLRDGAARAAASASLPDATAGTTALASEATSPGPGSFPPAPAPTPSPAAGARAPVAAQADRAIAVSPARLDRLVDLVGDLAVAQSRVWQEPHGEALDSSPRPHDLDQLGKVTRDLQQAAMSLRTVPIALTFEKLARWARATAGKAGKRVVVTRTGADVELDRHVVEPITAALAHALRWAIGHGTETAAAGTAGGKDAAVQLALAAYRDGGSLVLEVVHEGRGGDEGQAGALAAGLDAVGRDLEPLGATIEIDARCGRGSVCRLRLPPTWTLLDGTVVRVGGNRYVVPSPSIEWSCRVAAGDVQPLAHGGLGVRVGGVVLPFDRLHNLLAPAAGLADVAQGIVLVVDVDHERRGLLVDEVVGQQPVVVKPLGLPRDSRVGLAGGAILADGRVALVLDLARLGAAVANASPPAASAASWRAAAASFAPGSYLVCQVAGAEYAIAIAKVREVIRLADVTPLPGASACLRGVANHRGSVLPVIDLGQPFAAPPPAAAGEACVVVVDVGKHGGGDGRIGCLVDRVDEVVALGAAQFAATAPGDTTVGPAIAGLATCSERRLFVLDVERLLDATAGSAPVG